MPSVLQLIAKQAQQAAERASQWFSPGSEIRMQRFLTTRNQALDAFAPAAAAAAGEQMSLAGQMIGQSLPLPEEQEQQGPSILEQLSGLPPSQVSNLSALHDALADEGLTPEDLQGLIQRARAGDAEAQATIERIQAKVGTIPHVPLPAEFPDPAQLPPPRQLSGFDPGAQLAAGGGGGGGGIGPARPTRNTLALGNLPAQQRPGEGGATVQGVTTALQPGPNELRIQELQNQIQQAVGRGEIPRDLMAELDSLQPSRSPGAAVANIGSGALSTALSINRAGQEVSKVVSGAVLAGPASTGIGGGPLRTNRGAPISPRSAEALAQPGGDTVGILREEGEKLGLLGEELFNPVNLIPIPFIDPIFGKALGLTFGTLGKLMTKQGRRLLADQASIILSKAQKLVKEGKGGKPLKEFVGELQDSLGKAETRARPSDPARDA
ncbi:MAG: hypothetical protein IIC89_04350, partial [Chloroflexi bacterium]|nr:hypothetical protein [Chloroflexota bacterium]